MKGRIISAAIGIIIGCVIGVVAIHYQSIQRQKSINSINRVHINTIDYVPSVEADWCYTRQEYESRWFIRMRDAGKKLADMGVEIPPQVIRYCENAGKIYNISPEFLEAICWVESNCDPNAVNGTCKGIMQVSDIWHFDRMERLGVTSIFDEEGNILVAADYLSELFSTYGDNDPLVLDYYNGNSNADENARNGIISDYARKVLTIANLLERANGK